ncbi:hypothetical protein FQA47_015449 [Oryzias melastigma]|uniref:Uncharacterized protein n=1 Tax=Oryzias melastigma TaxID=30732 RepID=A0A834FQ22_ORYME|nr:hypothetical protein FQA47_015449 [Oryzias melastigma]
MFAVTLTDHVTSGGPAPCWSGLALRGAECVTRVGLISEQKNFLFRFTFLLKVWSSETASLTVLEADDEGQAKPGQTRPDQVIDRNAVGGLVLVLKNRRLLGEKNSSRRFLQRPLVSPSGVNLLNSRFHLEAARAAETRLGLDVLEAITTRGRQSLPEPPASSDVRRTSRNLLVPRKSSWHQRKLKSSPASGSGDSVSAHRHRSSRGFWCRRSKPPRRRNKLRM